jgi:Carboxypeptidase regulatory-like domain
MRILGLILLGLVGMQQTPRPTASIRGIVVQSGTLQPVAKAVVQLAKDNTSEPLVFSTGADGRFEFQNVAAGSYDLTAARNGYLNTAFGQRGPSGSGGKLTVEAGSNVDNIRLMMTATGTISGRVFDNTGEPLANVPVQALKYSYEDGQRTLTQVKIDQTNDLGEFRLFWLPPGQYTISAQPQDGRAGMVLMMHDVTIGAKRISLDSNGVITDPSTSGAQKPGEAYVPVYYPGTADPQSASRVEVRPGADVRGIDFILARVTTRKVRGTVINVATGQPADVANVQLVPRSGIGNTFTGFLDHGKFEVSGVLPGAYFLVAIARFGPRDDIKIMGGRTTVDVAYADLDNISVTLQPSIDIEGSMTVEGRAEGLPADAHPIIFLQGRRDGILPSLSQFYASFSNSTQFQFNNVVEGDYQIWWDKLPAGMYVKSAMFGPVDALNMGIHIDSRTTDRMQVVLSSNAGTLEGIVRDNLRNVVPRARVALVPDSAHRQRADLYQSTSTDESGRFRLQGIPPGDYSLFAWEDIEKDLWQDPEFIKRQESSGRPVRIIENGRETVETVAIPFAF